MDAVDTSKLPAVKSLGEAMESSDYFLDVLLEQEFGEPASEIDSDEVDGYLRRLMSAMDKTWSSTCSTIGSPRISRSELAQAIRRRLSHTSSFDGIGKPLFGIEKAKQCIFELDLLYPKSNFPQHCLFEEYGMFLADEVVRIKDVLMAKSGQEAWDALLPIMKLFLATKRFAPCRRQGCDIEAKEADSHDGCTPCTAFSKANMNHPGLQDPTMLLLVCFCSHRNQIQEKRATYENVDPVYRYVWQACGHLCWCDKVDTCPTDMGFAIHRKRPYLSMRHRVKSLEDISPLARFYRRFQRVCRWSCIEFCSQPRSH